MENNRDRQNKQRSGSASFGKKRPYGNNAGGGKAQNRSNLERDNSKRGGSKRGNSGSGNLEHENSNRDNPRHGNFMRENSNRETQAEDIYRLEGRKAVLEAINHDRQIDKIFIKKGEIEGTLRLINAKAREKSISVIEVSKIKLDEMSQSRNHQGVIALVPAKDYSEVSDILDYARERGEEPFVIILDGITDTYNFGAIIRSANACGAHGIIIPKRRSATLTGMVAKASSGAVEFVRIARVSNIAAAVEGLQEKGLWVYCSDSNEKSMYEQQMTGPVALVIGEEGEGVSRIVKEKCDFSVGIPMFGEIPSLNASVAAGILMYEVVRQRSL
ncbi:MAG: 23S rRNA (guanosine(2251)-2'-O)-methyltransferase RlmB [Clostridiales bacterium]|jgi:23S rRNA (guanosine2251-2'-O)-methyltransferase|nr:23S rRNA (guanosine(2251)-2'-O)-methyltransferase RlmB [Clostridiales bacterium]